jgi:succinoglycan biosynthesis transport protein ExoP
MSSQFEEIEEPGMDLRHYYTVLLKHKFLIFTCLVLYVSVNLYFTLKMEPVYQSSTTLLFESPRSASPFPGNYADYESYSSQYLAFNTHAKLITNRPVLERVVRELRLDQPESKNKLSPSPLQAFIAPIKQNISKLLKRERKEITPEERQDQIINNLRDKIEIMPIEDTRIMQIFVEDTDPVLARDIANSLARAYIQFNITNSMQASQSSFQTMQEQSYELKKKLEDADREFLQFKQEEQLFSIAGKQETIAQKISEFNELAVKNRSELQEITARLNELQALTSGNDLEVMRIRSLLNNPVIDRLNEQLIEAEIELSKLRKVYRDIHPKVAKVLGSIEDTKKEIKNQLNTELTNMKKQQWLLLAREKDLQKNIAELEKESLALGQKEMRYAVLQRNVETNQKLYDTLLEKLGESDVSESFSNEPIRIAEIAQVPLAPIKPNKKRNVLVSIVIGLLGGIGIAFFREYMDQTIHTEEDVQKYYGLPVLTVVPIASQAGNGYGYVSRSRREGKSEDKEAGSQEPEAGTGEKEVKIEDTGPGAEEEIELKTEELEDLTLELEDRTREVEAGRQESGFRIEELEDLSEKRRMRTEVTILPTDDEAAALMPEQETGPKTEESGLRKELQKVFRSKG